MQNFTSVDVQSANEYKFIKKIFSVDKRAAVRTREENFASRIA